MGSSKNYGPFLVKDYISAPKYIGAPKKDPALGNSSYNAKRLQQQVVLSSLLGRRPLYYPHHRFCRHLPWQLSRHFWCAMVLAVIFAVVVAAAIAAVVAVVINFINFMGA